MGVRATARSPLVVYCGNDGGIFRCTAGVNFTSLNGGGFQSTLFYNLDVTPDATASVTLGALQDNGIVTTSGAIAPTWTMGAGGDGFDVAHDGVLASQVYGRSNANIFRSTDNGGSYGGITPPWPAGGVGRLSRRRGDRSLSWWHRLRRAAIRICGRAPTAARRGQTRSRFLVSPRKWTSRRTTATTSSSPIGGRVFRVHRRARAGGVDTQPTSRATFRADSSEGSRSIPTIRRPSTRCSADSAGRPADMSFARR